MARHTRTLLLFGFILTLGTGAGCIIETTGDGGGSGYGPGPGGGGCLDSQYFVVEWEVDNGVGTSSLACAQAPASHVEVTMNTGGAAMALGNVSCDDRYAYNWVGATASSVPVGTAVVRADLVSDADGTSLSSAVVPTGQEVPIAACTGATLKFQFGLAP